MRRRELLMEYYRAMREALGPRRWWPARTPFEVCVGAVLTQNTSWAGVEKAIANLDAAGALTPEALFALPQDRLEHFITPAGSFRLKAKRLRNLLEYLKQNGDFDLEALAGRNLHSVREELLEVKGVGPETADSILCYALGMPSFVADASTRRILNRHALLPEDAGYEETREFFMDVLEPDPGLYNDFHAQLARVGNLFCRPKKPLCGQCPLGPYLP